MRAELIKTMQGTSRKLEVSIPFTDRLNEPTRMGVDHPEPARKAGTMVQVQADHAVHA